MNIITFSNAVSMVFTRSTGQTQVNVPPYVPYVFGRAQYGALVLDQIRPAIFRTSALAPRLEAFNVKNPARGRVLVYNGSGGFGDQIMTWPFTKILADMGYDVHVLADPGNEICWQLFPWIKGVHALPMQLENLNFFDHHAFYEVVVNSDEHPDQRHPLDTMLAQAGIDPASIPVSAKVVSPFFSQAELDEEAQMFQGKSVAIYQMHTGSVTRSLSPVESANMLRRLAEAFPDLVWVAIYDNLVGGPYKAEMARKNLPKNVQLCQTPKLRWIWSLAQRAKLVVAPDSMMAHIAGSLGTPCVGLWGQTDPSKRVAYYANHYPVWPKQACPFSACHSFIPDFPHYCPPSMTPRTQCEVMSAIKPEMVIEAVGCFVKP